jgi:hypothetical protein
MLVSWAAVEAAHVAVLRVTAQSVAVVPDERMNGGSRDDGCALLGRPPSHRLMNRRNTMTSVMNAMGMGRCGRADHRTSLLDQRKRDREGERQRETEHGTSSYCSPLHFILLTFA